MLRSTPNRSSVCPPPLLPLRVPRSLPPQGQFEFVGELNTPAWTRYNDFGSGDIPMKKTYYDALKAQTRSMVHIPIAIGGIGIFHSVPTAALPTAGRIHLSGCVLAKVFARIITTWDHPEIVALNAGLKVPKDQNIQVVHRTLGSSSTSGVTQYLDLVCKEQWSAGPKTMATGSTIVWGTDTFAGQGSGGVAAEIKTTPYSIGYLDAGHGHSENFGEVELKNKNGKYVDSKAADIGAAAAVALAAGVLPDDASADHSAVNLYDQTGDLTWPITMMSYFYIEKDLSTMDVKTAALLKAFVTFATTDPEGVALAESYKFVKLPQSVQDKNKATLNTITWPTAMKEFTFETAAKTQKGGGAGDYVLSGKRQCIGAYERSGFASSITTLNAENHDHAAPITPAGSKTGGTASTGADGKMSLNPLDVDNATPIAAVALVFALLALLVSIYGTFCKKGGAKSLPQ